MSSPSSPTTPPIQSGKSTAPPRPPKIPPAPNDNPPPYTPYGDVSSSLLPQQQHSNSAERSSNSSPRVVRPTGIRRITSYCTKRNCIICAVLFGVILLVLLVLNIWLSLSHDEDQRPIPLEFSSRSLARFHIPDHRISFDKNSDSIVLSRFFPAQKQLKSEKLTINEYDIGFLTSTQNFDASSYEECMRFTEHVICCETPNSVRHHKTDCWERTENGNIEVHAPYYDFVKDWQSLQPGTTAVMLYNPQRHGVLHFQRKKVYKIEENKLPEGYISMAFYFPMDTIDELDELVRSRDEFKICEYTLSERDQYDLKEGGCKDTRFHVDFDLNNVKFCSNPLYDAVLQYGHYRNEDELSWYLRVEFESSEYIYDAQDKLHSPVDTVAMDCSDGVIDIFALGAQQVIEYSVELPTETNSHFKIKRSLNMTKWDNTALFSKNPKFSGKKTQSNTAS